MIRAMLSVVLLFSAAASVEAAAFRSGDRVVVIAGGPLGAGEKIIGRVSPGLTLTVADVNGDQILVENGQWGWLETKYVVPLDRQAIHRLTGLIRDRPNDLDLVYGRGEARRLLGDLDGAKSDFDDVIRRNPKYTAAYLGRGRAWGAQREFDKAIADCDEAIRLDSTNAESYILRGYQRLEKQEFDKAIADYDAAIELDPNNAVAYAERGDAKGAMQDYEGAVADCDEAIRLAPKFAAPYLVRGTIRYKQEPEKALADFDEAIRLDPNGAVGYHKRAFVRNQRGEYEAAMADYDEIIRRNPKDVLAFLSRGYVRSLKKEYDRAIADVDQAIRLDPKNASAYGARASLWIAKGDYDRAIADYDEAIRLDPKEAGNYLNRGLVGLLNHHRAAGGDFRRVLELGGYQWKRSAYAVLFGVANARLQGDEKEAGRFLTESEGKLKTEWPLPCVEFFRGKLDAAKLLALATDRDQETEARCYVGLDHLIHKRPAEARREFQWVVERGNQKFIEYDIAKAELKRLEGVK